MLHSPPRLTDSPESGAPPRHTLGGVIPSCDLKRLADGWLLACDIERHSERTIERRRDILHKLAWFADMRGLDAVDTQTLRAFLHYLTHGHEEPGGRWGNPRCTSSVRPRTVHTVHGHLRTFFTWLVEEEIIARSPMERIGVPVARADQIQPFTAEECDRLLAAAQRTKYAKRDVAIHYFLLDTGVRASELCGLANGDLDMAGKALVHGKGDKSRVVPFHRTTRRALWNYGNVGSGESAPDSPVFMGERGPLTRSGLAQIVERWGIAAHVANAHPHRYRHTFAVEFLRDGGNVFTLQQILGHSSLHMTQRYVAFAQADVEAQHRKHSPVEAQRRRKRG